MSAKSESSEGVRFFVPPEPGIDTSVQTARHTIVSGVLRHGPTQLRVKFSDLGSKCGRRCCLPLIVSSRADSQQRDGARLGATSRSAGAMAPLGRGVPALISSPALMSALLAFRYARARVADVGFYSRLCHLDVSMPPASATSPTDLPAPLARDDSLTGCITAASRSRRRSSRTGTSVFARIRERRRTRRLVPGSALSAAYFHDAGKTAAPRADTVPRHEPFAEPSRAGTPPENWTGAAWWAAAACPRRTPPWSSA